MLCAALAAVAIFPSEPSSIAYYALMLVTLPVGVVAATITYLGGILLFGPDPDGLVARTTIFAIWVGLAAAQMLATRVLIRTSRRKPRVS